jgi:hypothetical protein
MRTQKSEDAVDYRGGQAVDKGSDAIANDPASQQDQ